MWIFIFKANPQGSSSVTQNGHGDNNDEHTSNGAPEKEAVDIKDVELTLLPSYLHEQESVNVIDNTDLLQSISKPNPQLSPPKRPPRSNHSPEGNYANFMISYITYPTINNPQCSILGMQVCTYVGIYRVGMYENLLFRKQKTTIPRIQG